MNDVLTVNWSAREGSADGLERLGTVADLRAHHPEHPVCALARRGGDAHAGAGGHHPGSAGSGDGGGVWDNPLDGNPGRGDLGNLGWFPFS